MNVLFAGTPQIAVPALEAVADHHHVVGVLTNPDRKSGRGKKSLPPPVKEKAQDLGIPVFQFESLKREARAAISPLAADILVVFAYGRIFGPKFLALFPKGGVNIHPSLLPRYRGSVPMTAAILNGDRETGVTIQKIALELDSGDILLQESFPLTLRETGTDLSDRSAEIGAELIAKSLALIEEGKVQSRRQDPEQASYCRRLRKEDGLINWRLPALLIERMVRAYTPWPRAFTCWRGHQLSILEAVLCRQEDGNSGDGPGSTSGNNPYGEVLGVDRKNGILIQTGMGLLSVQRLQLQGKKPLFWKDFVNGNKDLVGSQLGDV